LFFTDINSYGYLLRYMPRFRFSDFSDSACAYALEVFIKRFFQEVLATLKLDSNLCHYIVHTSLVCRYRFKKHLNSLPSFSAIFQAGTNNF